MKRYSPISPMLLIALGAASAAVMSPVPGPVAPKVDAPGEPRKDRKQRRAEARAARKKEPTP